MIHIDASALIDMQAAQLINWRIRAYEVQEEFYGDPALTQRQ